MDLEEGKKMLLLLKERIDIELQKKEPEIIIILPDGYLNIQKSIKIILQELQELQVLEDDIQENRIAYIDTPEFEEKYISKNKIKDKIEELNQEYEEISNLLSEPDVNIDDIDREQKKINNQIDVLDELLEEEK